MRLNFVLHTLVQLILFFLATSAENLNVNLNRPSKHQVPHAPCNEPTSENAAVVPHDQLKHHWTDFDPDSSEESSHEILSQSWVDFDPDISKEDLQGVAKHYWLDFDPNSSEDEEASFSNIQQRMNSFSGAKNSQSSAGNNGELEEGQRKRSTRVKRQLIIPGTNWCGVGNVSRNNEETGDLASVDKCCRQHDHCPYTIAGFRTKYNLYNFRFHTISHCECDDIFRTCLKMSGHEQADAVGELFFDMIGMKCFVFRKEQVCAERTWWGRCERHKYQYNAETRDPVRYTNTN